MHPLRRRFGRRRVAGWGHHPCRNSFHAQVRGGWSEVVGRRVFHRAPGWSAPQGARCSGSLACNKASAEQGSAWKLLALPERNQSADGKGTCHRAAREGGPVWARDGTTGTGAAHPAALGWLGSGGNVAPPLMPSFSPCSVPGRVAARLWYLRELSRGYHLRLAGPKGFGAGSGGEGGRWEAQMWWSWILAL